MTVAAVLSIVAAAAFAVVSGANDGGTLVAMGLKVTSIKPLVAIGLLTLAVVTGPFLFGTQVATTLADRLVSFEGAVGDSALLVAVIAALSIVTVLSRRGLPTSLTLALMGGSRGPGSATGSLFRGKRSRSCWLSGPQPRSWAAWAVLCSPVPLSGICRATVLPRRASGGRIVSRSGFSA